MNADVLANLSPLERTFAVIVVGVMAMRVAVWLFIESGGRD